MRRLVHFMRLFLCLTLFIIPELKAAHGGMPSAESSRSSRKSSPPVASRSKLLSIPELRRAFFTQQLTARQVIKQLKGSYHVTDQVLRLIPSYNSRPFIRAGKHHHDTSGSSGDGTSGPSADDTSGSSGDDTSGSSGDDTSGSSGEDIAGSSDDDTSGSRDKERVDSAFQNSQGRAARKWIASIRQDLRARGIREEELPSLDVIRLVLQLRGLLSYRPTVADKPTSISIDSDASEKQILEKIQFLPKGIRSFWCTIHLSPRAWKLLLEFLPQSVGLETFFLSHNIIDTEKARALAHALGHLTNLNSLSLNHNSIGGQGARALADALPSLKNLHDLDLSYNPIGDEGAHALAGVLSRMKQVKVRFADDTMTAEGRRSIITAAGSVSFNWV